MATRDPKQFIIEHISQPLGRREPSPPSPGISRTGWQAESRSGEGLGAKAATVQFLQERHLPDRQLHLVAFENETGHQEQWFCCIRASNSGDWQFAGGANITGAETMPRRGFPWVNLAGGWRGDLFWAGGRVLDQGLDVIRVRLISANNMVLEDTVQSGLVLFLADQVVQRPLRAELYDRAEQVVGVHQVLPWKPPEPVE